MNSAQLFATFDRISDGPNAISSLKRFIIDLAVRGKLVKQDIHDEPASELLLRIEQQINLQNKINRESLPNPIDHDEVDFRLPRGWALARLGRLIRLVSGQHLQPSQYSKKEGSGLPYITGPADFGEKGLVITRYAIVKKAVAVKGQILLTVKGAGVGKTAICDLPEVAISRQLMAMTAVGWNQKFLLLTTHHLADTLKLNARSLIPGISREDVNDYVFPLPPLAEQQRIVNRVDELMALCDRLEAALNDKESILKNLREAVFHRLQISTDLSGDQGRSL